MRGEYACLGVYAHRELYACAYINIYSVTCICSVIYIYVYEYKRMCISFYTHTHPKLSVFVLCVVCVLINYT